MSSLTRMASKDPCGKAPLTRKGPESVLPTEAALPLVACDAAVAGRCHRVCLHSSGSLTEVGTRGAARSEPERGRRKRARACPHALTLPWRAAHPHAHGRGARGRAQHAAPVEPRRDGRLLQSAGAGRVHRAHVPRPGLCAGPGAAAQAQGAPPVKGSCAAARWPSTYRVLPAWLVGRP